MRCTDEVDKPSSLPNLGSTSTDVKANNCFGKPTSDLFHLEFHLAVPNQGGPFTSKTGQNLDIAIEYST
jgi:hypothetical protein